MLKQLKYVIIGIILLVGLIAYLDTIGYSTFQAVGGFGGEVYNKMESGYLQQFWIFSYALIIVAASVYYFFRKDLSETLAIVFSYIWLVATGWEDIFYYLIRGIPFDSSLPWLDGTPVMGGLSRLLGYPGVTSTTLFICAILGIVGVYFIVKTLANINYSFSIGGYSLKI